MELCLLVNTEFRIKLWIIQNFDIIIYMILSSLTLYDTELNFADSLDFNVKLYYSANSCLIEYVL